MCKCCIYFQYSFLKGKCKIKLICLFVTFKVSPISCSFTLQFANTIMSSPLLDETHIVGVCTAAFKVLKPLLYHLSSWNEIRITFVKRRFDLNDVISPSESNDKLTHKIAKVFKMFHKSTVTKTSVTCDRIVMKVWSCWFVLFKTHFLVTPSFYELLSRYNTPFSS